MPHRFGRASAWASHLRRFLRPIDDRELPHLDDRMRRGVRSLAAIAVGAVLTLASVGGLTGAIPPERALLMGSSYGLSAGFTFWLANPRQRRVRASVAVLVFMVLMTLASTFIGVITEGELRAMATYVVVLPLIASAVFAWRPRWSLALGIIATGLPLLVVRQDISVPLQVYVLYGVTYTAIAAVATQTQRHLWLELEATRSQMIASDRMSTLGQMIAGIAHELKTPNAAAANSLARVKALSSELSKSIGHAEVTDADLREIAAELAAASELAIRGTERVGRFLQALRSQTLGMHETNVVPFRILERVGNALALLEHKAGRAGIRVETAGDSTIGVTGDPSKFEQVITNLVLNALDAIEEAGAGSLVRVSVDLRGEGVRVVVEDDGPGIPAALREQVFEPLFTTRAAHGGTGLGLSICRDVIEGAFGGKLHLAAAPSGARFEIFLPDGGSVAASHRQFAPGSAQAS